MLKYAKILILVLSLCISNITYAKDCGDCKMKSGGYIASDSDVISVKEAQSMKDKYKFVDATGSMTVKIGKKVWQGQAVNSSDEVQITGEIDRDKDDVSLDVENLIKK